MKTKMSLLCTIAKGSPSPPPDGSITTAVAANQVSASGDESDASLAITTGNPGTLELLQGYQPVLATAQGPTTYLITQPSGNTTVGDASMSAEGNIIVQTLPAVQVRAKRQGYTHSNIYTMECCN